MRLAPRFGQTEHGDVSGLVGVQILACRLAQFFRRLGDIEDVVDHLEGQADRITEFSQRGPF